MFLVFRGHTELKQRLWVSLKLFVRTFRCDYFEFNTAFSSTEKELNTKCVVEMVKNQTVLHPATVNLGKGDSRYVISGSGKWHAVWP